MQESQENIQRVHFAAQAAAYADFMNTYKEDLITGDTQSNSSVLNNALIQHTTPSRFFYNIPEPQLDTMVVNTPKSTVSDEHVTSMDSTRSYTGHGTV